MESCYLCKLEKPIEVFQFVKEKLNRICLVCNRHKALKNYYENREKRMEYNKKYGYEKIKCEVCNVIVNKRNLIVHNRSKKHKQHEKDASDVISTGLSEISNNQCYISVA